MTRRILFTPALLLTLIGVSFIGCTPDAATTKPQTDPNNTGMNVRDRQNTSKTPFDQNETSADIKITADIRQQIVDTKMSTDAQNVKVITQNGKVTLRGPVETVQEKSSIEKIARSIAGANQVESLLEVKN